MPTAFPTLVECFGDLPDPRVERTRAYPLMDILIMGICATICGGEGWEDMAEFAKAKRDWLTQHLQLPGRTPCADTFRRVFSRVDPAALQECFRRWTLALHALTEGEVIALDGKTLRHSFDTACAMAAVHMVSAWASKARLVLGQVKVAEKSNEIPAVPALLALLDIRGCIVTADALNCQRATAAQIIAGGGEYVLAVKGNQPTLEAAVVGRLDYLQDHPFEEAKRSVCTRHDKGHGRLETRTCELVTLDTDDALWGDLQQEWAGLRSFARITCTRQMGEKVSEEVRYFISSLPGSASKVLSSVRQHWGIENRLHYVLDVSMDEDACRIRKDHAAQNLAVLRHIALNLMRQETTCKCGIKARLKLAGWDTQYMAKILLAEIQ